MEWAEVIKYPLFQNLPLKVELNKWGKVLMSPASNNHDGSFKSFFDVQRGVGLSDQMRKQVVYRSLG